MAHSHADPNAAPAGQQGSLWSLSFFGLLSTQLLTATNDNIFRWLVIGIAKDYFPESVSVVLGAGTACFVVPYLVLAAPAGFLADRFSKRHVIVGCKIAEVFIMCLGVAAIWLGNVWFLFTVVAMMGAHSALFSPSKMGSIPEMLKPQNISAANGMFGLTTVASTALGMGLGSWLSDVTGNKGQDNLWASAAVLLGVAAVGLVSSLAIKRLAVGDPQRKIPWDAFSQTVRDLRLLASRPALLRVAIGMVFFWAVGALAQLNIDQLAFEGGAINESAKNSLLISLVFGVGFGSLLAGVWSGGHVELGILPLGAFGVALCSMLLFTVPAGIILGEESTWTAGYIWACVLLFGLGTSAGLFSVPLEAYMQHRSDPHARGSILSAANFLIFGGVLLSAGLYTLLRTPVLAASVDGVDAVRRVPLFTARQIFLLTGLFTLPIFLYIIWIIPQATTRFAVWMGSYLFYRIRVHGRENLPERGGALLTSNHVSWLDGFLFLMVSSRPVRIIAWAGNFQAAWFQRLARYWGVIIMSGGPKSIVKSLREAQEALKNGELVVIFPEGGITRTAQVQGFKPGMMKILEGTNAPVIPVYLDELWGSRLLERGLKTLDVRVRRQNENAQRVAEWCAERKEVKKVHYSGLPGHPDHQIAKSTLDGFGGMMAIELSGGARATEKFLRKLRIIRHAPSLGGVDSLVSEPRYTSHAHLTAEARASAGVPDGFLRLSIGIESAQDLIADIEQALR